MWRRTTPRRSSIARHRAHRRTLAADKAYDTAEFVAALRDRNVTPHVAANDGRKGGSTLDGRTTRHAGYTASQRLRKRVEEIFGWCSDWDDR